MLATLDNLHFSFNAIDGHQKPFNFIISPREDGKSTAAVVTKAYKAFIEEGRASIFLRRDKNDITDIYINSILLIIKKFKDEGAEFHYKRTKNEGFLAVYLNEYDKPFLYFMALNQEKSNFKSLVIGDIAYIFVDEFIIDTRAGEKYSPDEPGKVKELYSTFNREASKPIKIYWLGNPYSLYNPYFVAFGIDPKRLTKGAIVTGKEWAAQRHILNPALVELIKKKNPMYDQFANDAWYKYAMEGEAINDVNIRVEEKPAGFAIFAIIVFEGRYYAIWNDAQGFAFDSPDYYVSRESSVGKRRVAYAFDFKDLVLNSQLYGKDDKRFLSRFKRAVMLRRVAYQDLDCSYTIENLFASI